MKSHEQLRLDFGTAETPKVKPVFARHETFHPRFGWLKKGFDAAVKSPEVFLREDAPVRLGVGKNMVSSIRYWCTAFKVLEADKPTDFGRKLLADEGWDPFLEDPASLWLLHWKLLSPPEYPTAWYFTFNVFRSVEFSADELYQSLCKYRDTVARNIADSSVKKDISCILRMYVKQGSKTTGASEDSLDCPFAELGIIHTAGDERYYTFRIGPKRNLPAEIVVSACLDFASRVGRSQRTISISRLLYDMGSPGMAFKLSQSAICEAIERVQGWFGLIKLAESAGLIQFSFDSDPADLAVKILNRYYEARGSAATR